MQHITFAAVTVALLAALGSPAQATGEMILGDSLGVGVKAASGHPGTAKLSVFIRNDQALSQINSVPPGATAFLVLGTNDSAGSVKGLEKFIDNIVQAADRRGIKLVWIGPPCVRKSWDKNSKELDAILTARLDKTSVKYVSIRDETLCSGAYQGAEGVHLNMQGYAYLWHKARVAAGLPESDDSPIKIASAKPRRQHKPVMTADAGTPAMATTAPDAKPRKRRSRVARAEPAPTGFFAWFRRN